MRADVAPFATRLTRARSSTLTMAALSYNDLLTSNGVPAARRLARVARQEVRKARKAEYDDEILRVEEHFLREKERGKMRGGVRRCDFASRRHLLNPHPPKSRTNGSAQRADLLKLNKWVPPPTTKKWVADLLKEVETKGKRASRENDDEFSHLLDAQQMPARGSTEYDD